MPYLRAKNFSNPVGVGCSRCGLQPWQVLYQWPLDPREPAWWVYLSNIGFDKGNIHAREKEGVQRRERCPNIHLGYTLDLSLFIFLSSINELLAECTNTSYFLLKSCMRFAQLSSFRSLFMSTLQRLSTSALQMEAMPVDSRPNVCTVVQLGNHIMQTIRMHRIGKMNDFPYYPMRSKSDLKLTHSQQIKKVNSKFNHCNGLTRSASKMRPDPSDERTHVSSSCINKLNGIRTYTGLVLTLRRCCALHLFNQSLFTEKSGIWKSIQWDTHSRQLQAMNDISHG